MWQDVSGASLKESDSLSQMERIMSYTARRGGLVAAAAFLLVASTVPAAQARPYVDPRPRQTSYAAACPLERIGRQFVHCDNLTGHGVDAPSWVPEQVAWGR
jgi:hypothetical protein